MSAWAETLRRLPTFRSAVLTGLDGEGYPYSARCRPRADHGARLLRLDLPPGAPVRPGPAALLCHEHDEYLWRQRSFVARGTLERGAGGWAFRPERVIPGIGAGGVLGLIRFSHAARRTAGRYLAARRLPRPRVPWAEINAIKAEARRATRAARARR